MSFDTKLKKIANFDDLIKVFEIESQKLKLKYKESYWVRYLFRRIPLFSGFAALFYGGCFLLTLSESVGSKVVNAFLFSIKPFYTEYSDEILIGAIVLLLLRTLLPCKWFVDFDDSKSGRKLWENKIEKPIAVLLMSSALVSGFYWTLASEHPLPMGLISFSAVMLGALLSDRSLGFTRRNERLYLYANRAERLAILSRSRKEMGIEFSESHLTECLEFFDALNRDKHRATVSDSFYMLREPGKLLGKGSA